MVTAGIKLTMNKENNVVSVGMMTVCGVVDGWNGLGFACQFCNGMRDVSGTCGVGVEPLRHRGVSDR